MWESTEKHITSTKSRIIFFPQLVCDFPSHLRNLYMYNIPPGRLLTLVFEIWRGYETLFTESSSLATQLRRFICAIAHTTCRLMYTQAFRAGYWFMHHGSQRDEKTTCAEGRCERIESLMPSGCQDDVLGGLHVLKTQCSSCCSL